MYRDISSSNSPTNVYLIFNEIEISKSSILYNNIFDIESKTFRHADGTENAKNFPLVDGEWLDPDTETAPIIFPDYNYGNASSNISIDYVVANVQKYFEIFDINILVANRIPDNFPLGSRGARYVKVMPPIDPFSSRTRDIFNSLPPKYYPYKRIVWWHDKIGSLNSAYPPFNFATHGHGDQGYSQFKQWLVADLVHEIGHLYALSHQGDVNDDPRLIQEGNSYYGSQQFVPLFNPDWGPIMGSPIKAKIAQWSNTDYVYALNNNSKPHQTFENQLLQMIQWGGAKLKKRPSVKLKPAIPGPDTGGMRIGGIYDSLQKGTKDHLYARYATASDTEIIGMIGYERDYDIIKILLPKGNYSFKLEPYLQGNEKVSMLKPNLEILYCQAELKKSSSFVSEDQYPDIWIPDSSSISNLKSKNIFHKVYMDNPRENYGTATDLPKVEDIVITEGFPVAKSPADNLDHIFESSITNFSVEYLTLVYLRVRGAYELSVDPRTLKPDQGYSGHSNFGSMGKYKLTIPSPSSIVQTGSPLPYGRFEEFIYCKNGDYEKVWLLVQDENDNSTGGALNSNNIRSLELDIIVNGRTEKKKFIVFGEPRELDYPEEQGKFYLTVVIDGVCKKQEFIIGMARPEENA